MGQLLGHLFPPFDAWWPNIIASLVWVPLAGLSHWIISKRRHQQVTALLRKLHEREEQK